ncbi:methyltransferase domain-containing protein [Flavobacterium sp. 14A]|uniref:methyltransferase domain-containing protein n=1 Tax=Flavobacterium sp. 14A TaxID=2735896 RepID=UPI00156E4571|nr:methyltransferase domain-containing protein [Flavobacterium sp. 14A]NRT10531.1 2-polyprenyl-3-methyl-5-hydroxy-6-metoxy-1,4-benzoquinol methylase [Flavobacterium sp. 14A]
MGLSTKCRTDQEEIMDDFAMEGEVLRDALDKIASINQLLGGNKLTLNGVKDMLSTAEKKREFTIVDVGCGNGDMLRALADYATSKGLTFKLVGIDANNFTITHARALSTNYANISYLCENIFDKEFENLKYDIVLCTLTLHHFKDDQIQQLLRVFYNNATLGVVINDLHRSKIAYRSFQALCKVFGLNDMSREDGLVSILRGFKKVDLIQFSKKLGFRKYDVKWKWAFRYQWIIYKI